MAEAYPGQVVEVWSVERLAWVRGTVSAVLWSEVGRWLRVDAGEDGSWWRLEDGRRWRGVGR